MPPGTPFSVYWLAFKFIILGVLGTPVNGVLTKLDYRGYYEDGTSEMYKGERYWTQGTQFTLQCVLYGSDLHLVPVSFFRSNVPAAMLTPEDNPSVHLLWRDGEFVEDINNSTVSERYAVDTDAGFNKMTHIFRIFSGQPIDNGRFGCTSRNDSLAIKPSQMVPFLVAAPLQQYPISLFLGKRLLAGVVYLQQPNQWLSEWGCDIQGSNVKPNVSFSLAGRSPEKEKFQWELNYQIPGLEMMDYRWKYRAEFGAIKLICKDSGRDIIGTLYSPVLEAHTERYRLSIKGCPSNGAQWITINMAMLLATVSSYFLIGLTL